MDDNLALNPIHPRGEDPKTTLSAEFAAALKAANEPTGELQVQTPGGKIFVEWDAQAPLTPVGQLVFFSQFLEVSGHLNSLCETCPVRLSSPNAPRTRDVVGTLLMGILCGHWRYSHLSGVRFDAVNPQLLAMGKVVSEDSARRFLAAMSREQSEIWLRGQLQACYGDLLVEPWVLDVDTTIKPIYGHQDAAKKGYNPTKPGRPSLAYHSYFIGHLRICLDVEVESGDRSAAKHGHAALWRILDALPSSQRPECLRGDLAYGEEKIMRQCEERAQNYLFKLRQSPRVKDLITTMERNGSWQDAGQGFEGIESSLRLKAWSAARRVVVLRRCVRGDRPSGKDLPLLESGGVLVEAEKKYETMVLVTNMDLPIVGLAQLYRDRADVENCFDELKNQWGWGGFTTRDVERSQTMARLVALIYNWWSLFVGLINPEKHAEAITSRPELLFGVGRMASSGRQTTVTVTSSHKNAAQTQKRQTWVGQFLSCLNGAAEQLGRSGIWRLILSMVFVRFLRGRIIGEPENHGLPVFS